MSFSEKEQTQNEFLKQICTYVHQATGLTLDDWDSEVEVSQKLDKKSLVIKKGSLSDVLARKDENDRDFLQVNFEDGRKLLLTDTLIGFRPSRISDLDMAKLPKVVTTPDIKSIFEAIQEALHTLEESSFEEVEVLRRVFEAVVSGGEAVGFDLSKERLILSRIPRRDVKASA